METLNVDAYRPKPFYFINDAREKVLARACIREALDNLKAAGFGGCVVFNKPPYGFSEEEFLGERWFRMIRRFAEEALETGMEIWVNDGFDYPPGNAAGRIKKVAPHLKQRRLALNSAGEVEELETPWGFPAFEEPESSRLFIEFTYEAYKRHVGGFFGNGIAGFFSDADNRRMPHGVLSEAYYPWSGNFSGEFEKAFGYAVEPHLKDILRGNPCQAAIDYWTIAGRLYQRWFANNHEWCRRNNLKYTFHSSDSGPFAHDEAIRSSIFAEGNPFEMHSHSDFPGTDHELRALNGGTGFKPAKLWFRERAFWGEAKDCLSPAFHCTHGDVRAKLASSAAFLYKRKGALCELFAATEWSSAPGDWRRIGVWQIMQGINFLVPHAVHHRMGSVKYFAPPEFMRCGSLSKSIRQLNGHLSWLCAVASQGELVAPIALLDPTEEIWRERKAFPAFFDLCDKLNRMPYGYVVAPPSALPDGGRSFRVALNPGMRLSADYREKLAAAGVAILEASELSRLPSLIECESSYSGEGTPHFMRRSVDNGETLMVANVEGRQEICGEVWHAGRSYLVALTPGEVAVFSPDFTSFRKPLKTVAKAPVPSEARIRWHAPNSITLCRWEDSEGRLMDRKALSAKEISIFFRWTNLDCLEDIRLLVPQKPLSALLDGKHVSSLEPRMLFDEEYLSLALDGSGAAGAHALELCFDAYREAAYANWPNPCYMEGNFDCEVNADYNENSPIAGIRCFLNFTLDLPKTAAIVLRRGKSLLRMDQSWAEQGRPFYSGRASYCFDIHIPASFKHPVLRFGPTHCQLELKVNGRELGCKAFPPYDFDLTGFQGDCSVEALVENTLGNRLDAYGAPSGLASPPELVDAAI